MNDRLSAELLTLAEGRIRSELAAAGSVFDRYHPRMEQGHVRNARRLEEVIVQTGWPGCATAR